MYHRTLPLYQAKNFRVFERLLRRLREKHLTISILSAGNENCIYGILARGEKVVWVSMIPNLEDVTPDDIIEELMIPYLEERGFDVRVGEPIQYPYPHRLQLNNEDDSFIMRLAEEKEILKKVFRRFC